VSTSHSLKDIAEWVNGTLEGEGDVQITGLAAIQDAGEGDLTFVTGDRYATAAEACGASALLVTEGVTINAAVPVIRVPNADRAFSIVVVRFAPEPTEIPVGIHPSAFVSDDATVDATARIGANVTIDSGAHVGPNVTIYPGCYIGAHAKVGEGTLLHARVGILERVEVGKRCILHGGVTLGGDGFGFDFDAGVHNKIPQRGTVIIEDDVEIGANSTVDRARFGATRVGQGTKIDSLCQVAHNVVLGRGCILAAQVGIAGSARLGNYVVIGGQAAVTGHIEIGDGVQIAGMAGVTKSFGPGLILSGFPAGEHSERKREQARVRKMPEQIRELKQELKALREQLQGEPANDTETC
jgi:UDP-3-O-[3-hydroxymyristoyl] glucosamine N-acyltransferase